MLYDLQARVKEQQAQKKLLNIKRIVCIGGGIALVLLVWIIMLVKSNSTGTGGFEWGLPMVNAWLTMQHIQPPWAGEACVCGQRQLDKAQRPGWCLQCFVICQACLGHGHVQPEAACTQALERNGH